MIMNRVVWHGSPVADRTKASQRIGEIKLGKLFNCQFIADFTGVANEVSNCHSKNGTKAPLRFCG